ncbi:RmlC-like cupin domain-containing protein [Entophlyctis helioformis]|nr:RmlC-like cupin domain-containing protein [Entophlyctis helioformis]
MTSIADEHAAVLATTPRNAAGIPIPATLEQLVAAIHAELDGEGLDSASVDVDRIQTIMAGYKSNPDDWERFALFDGSRYTRNLVDGGNGKFNLMILCWGAGQASPIHDHANSHCVLKVLDGNICETQYEWPEASSPSGTSAPAPAHAPDAHGNYSSSAGMHVKQEATYSTDAVTYMHDKIGLHKVCNPTSRGAVSLHLYTPPIDTCTTFCEKTGTSRPSGKCVFYSNRGERCTYIDDIKESLGRKGLECSAGSGMGAAAKRMA